LIYHRHCNCICLDAHTARLDFALAATGQRQLRRHHARPAEPRGPDSGAMHAMMKTAWRGIISLLKAGKAALGPQALSSSTGSRSTAMSALTHEHSTAAARMQAGMLPHRAVRRRRRAPDHAGQWLGCAAGHNPAHTWCAGPTLSKYHISAGLLGGGVCKLPHKRCSTGHSVCKSYPVLRRAVTELGVHGDRGSVTYNTTAACLMPHHGVRTP
jgi:hypothetical protein